MSRESGGRTSRSVARLLIVDDHELARLGLVGALQGERGIAIVGEARDGLEALQLCQELGPDLVLMDVRMPKMDGLSATAEIVKTCPRTSVIMLTMQEDPEYVLEALKVGASGYLLKDSGRPEIVNAIRQVLAGESLLNAGMVAELLQRLGRDRGAQPESTPAGSTHNLSDREVEVLTLLAAGKTNREIARDLVLSVSTVKTHVEHVIAKLEVADRTQAAVKATRLGIVRAAT
ncbi:MAG: response regulator transcription factor [Chloroflexi bacterium]|nr:response regulator transcription factor [Chloroflexota bacterium]